MFEFVNGMRPKLTLIHQTHQNITFTQHDAAVRIKKMGQWMRDGYSTSMRLVPRSEDLTASCHIAMLPKDGEDPQPLQDIHIKTDLDALQVTVTSFDNIECTAVEINIDVPDRNFAERLIDELIAGFHETSD